MGRIDEHLRQEREGDVFRRRLDAYALQNSRWYRLKVTHEARGIGVLAGLALLTIGPVAFIWMSTGLGVFAFVPFFVLMLGGGLLARRYHQRGARAFGATAGLPCPRCGHDLGRLPREETPCPECGALLDPDPVVANWTLRYADPRTGRLRYRPAWLDAAHERAVTAK